MYGWDKVSWSDMPLRALFVLSVSSFHLSSVEDLEGMGPTGIFYFFFLCNSIRNPGSTLDQGLVVRNDRPLWVKVYFIFM